MKTLIAALALVTLIAGPAFARPYEQGTFIFKSDRELCQSGRGEFCHWQGYPLWQWYSGA